MASNTSNSRAQNLASLSTETISWAVNSALQGMEKVGIIHGYGYGWHGYGTDEGIKTSEGIKHG